MADLVSSTDRTALKATLSDHFDTFKREIVVFKEPIRVVKNVVSNNSYAGYGENCNQVEFDYVAVSGVYSGIVNYYGNQESELGDELGNIMIGKGSVKIKIEQDARDFMLNGATTQAIHIDGNTFNKISDEKIQDYLGLKYYIFYLEKTD